MQPPSFGRLIAFTFTIGTAASAAMAQPLQFVSQSITLTSFDQTESLQNLPAGFVTRAGQRQSELFGFDENGLVSGIMLFEGSSETSTTASPTRIESRARCVLSGGPQSAFPNGDYGLIPFIGFRSNVEVRFRVLQPQQLRAGLGLEINALNFNIYYSDFQFATIVQIDEAGSPVPGGFTGTIDPTPRLLSFPAGLYRMRYRAAADVTTAAGGNVPLAGQALTGIRIVLATPGVSCDSIDFNNDGALFDPTDIDAMFSVFSEGPCIPASATCNDIDFNNDGSLFDPCDIDSFLLLFSEGPCTPCGL
jgi:hypothetical protein